MAEYANWRVVESDLAAGLKLMQMGFGRKMENGVVLEWLEAAYLLEKKLLEVRSGKKALTLEDLLAEPKKKNGKRARAQKKTKTDAPSRADQYAIYRALRAGGRLVRFSSGSPLLWRVYEKGIGREQERPQMVLTIVPPGWSATIESLERQLAVSRLLRLDLGMAFARDGKAVMIKISRPPI